MSTNPSPPVVPAVRCAVANLTKQYGGVRALNDVSVEFLAGEVHAILGENGAGKSTLMKILAGAESADSGDVELEGTVRRYSSVKEASSDGIAIVFQELSLFPELDVLANLFANREIKRFGVLDRRAMGRRARPILAELGLDLPLDALVADLPLHTRQLLEIAKALLTNVRVLILDEPTSSLSANETDRLLGVIRRLRDRDVTTILVSHRLEEVAAVADRVTVLRDGSFVQTVPMAQTTIAELVSGMLGHPPDEMPEAAPQAPSTEAPSLVLRDVTTAVLRSVDLEATPGEIVGLAGLEDAGVQQLLHAVFGLVRVSSGEITYPDGRGIPGSARAAVRRGIALVPADRRRDGLMLDDTILENVSSVKAGVAGGYGFALDTRRMRAAALESARALHIKYSSLDAPVGSLSGGNQQKVVLAKWLQIRPALVLLDDPTRGVDLGAKLEIYEVIRELARTGSTVVFSSSELEEYERLCRRVVILRRGRVSTTLTGRDISQHRVLHAMNA
ncbi:MAG: sugar ABC transporter ATP-binding protein [Microbacterium sp.]